MQIYELIFDFFVNKSIMLWYKKENSHVCHIGHLYGTKKILTLWVDLVVKSCFYEELSDNDPDDSGLVINEGAECSYGE